MIAQYSTRCLQFQYHNGYQIAANCAHQSAQRLHGQRRWRLMQRPLGPTRGLLGSLSLLVPRSLSVTDLDRAGPRDLLGLDAAGAGGLANCVGWACPSMRWLPHYSCSLRLDLRDVVEVLKRPRLPRAYNLYVTPERSFTKTT